MKPSFVHDFAITDLTAFAALPRSCYRASRTDMVVSYRPLSVRLPLSIDGSAIRPAASVAPYHRCHKHKTVQHTVVQVFLLQIKASLENVAKISLPEGHEYCIDVTLQCVGLQSSRRPRDMMPALCTCICCNMFGACCSGFTGRCCHR